MGWNLSVEIARGGSSYPLFPGMLAFVEGGKPENQEKNLQSMDNSQQQTQPTYENRLGNRTQATVWGCKHSQHCVIPTPLIKPDYVEILHTNPAPQFLWKPNHILLL